MDTKCFAGSFKLVHSLRHDLLKKIREKVNHQLRLLAFMGTVKVATVPDIFKWQATKRANQSWLSAPMW